jgi:hypothetical protein
MFTKEKILEDVQKDGSTNEILIETKQASAQNP